MQQISQNGRNFKQRYQEKKKDFARLAQKMKRRPAGLDELVHNAHEEVFSKTNCLHCANCCRTTSPLFLRKDIERLASRFKIRPADFTEKYLRLDEEGDYVFKSAPCPFLLEDNYCSVYESRPDACREYPHTSQRKFHQVIEVTLKNAAICPAVIEILELVEEKLRK